MQFVFESQVNHLAPIITLVANFAIRLKKKHADLFVWLEQNPAHANTGDSLMDFFRTLLPFDMAP